MKDLDIDGSRVFNLDEFAFRLCPTGERVIVEKEEKAMYNFVHKDEKECLTALFTLSATGVLAPSMIIFPYKKMPESIPRSMLSGWSAGKSDSGWQTAETFFEYICNVFEPWLTKNKIVRPVILYVGGHSSHITGSLVLFCRQKDIVLIALFPNATHLLQPLDVALFRPLTRAWKKFFSEWRLDNQAKIRREDFENVTAAILLCRIAFAVAHLTDSESEK